MNPKNSLEYFILPGAHPPSLHENAYDRAFEFWYRVWEDTFSALHGPFQLFSDEFTRQDQIGLLVYREDILASVCFRSVDLNRRASLKDSYFKPWLAEDLDRVRSIGPKALIGSHFAVSPRARGTVEGLPTKQLLMGLVAWTLVESSCDSLIGTPRRDKSVHTTAFEWGAEVVRENVDCGHVVPVDLVLFDRKKILAEGRHLQLPVVNQLFETRKNLTIDDPQIAKISKAVRRVS